MVGKSIKLSSKTTNHLQVINKPSMPCNSLKRNQKTESHLADDLSDICDDEVAYYLNTDKELYLKKIAWEMMNPDYQNGKQRERNPVKRRDPVMKPVLSKKPSVTTSETNTESQNKKRVSVNINYDVLNKLFGDDDDHDKSPKRAKLEKPVILDDQAEEDSQQNHEDINVKPHCSLVEEEEEEELNWNEDYNNDDAYGGGEEEEEFEDEQDDDEGIIW